MFAIFCQNSVYFHLNCVPTRFWICPMNSPFTLVKPGYGSAFTISEKLCITIYIFAVTNLVSFNGPSRH